VSSADARSLARWGATLLVVGIIGAAVFTRWQIGVNTQPDVSCLPYDYFVIDQRDQQPRRGGYVAFAAKNMGPYFKDGQRVVKEVVGVPGDHVRVTTEGVWVNGEYRGGLMVAQVLGEDLHRYERDETVPPGHYWLMGTHEYAFDSRYWGYADQSQIAGVAYPIF